MPNNNFSTTSQGINYPAAIEAPVTPYTNPPDTNPVLAGLPLRLLSEAVANITPLQSLLWSNAGFGSLRSLEATGILDPYQPRFDPTVIPHSAPIPPTSLPRLPKENPIFYCAGEYIDAYREKKLTPTAVTTKVTSLLASPQHSACIITPVTPSASPSDRRYATNAEAPRMKLDGVPILVKDELAVAGTPKTLGLTFAEMSRRGTNKLDDGETSWCVQKLIDAGALVVGKTNMHEIGFDTTNNNPNHGTPRNPYNPNYYTGGSSGGSAYAVAAGLVPIAVGADGGGSIRLPAGYCGVYGLKPTHGRISQAPTRSIAPSNGVIGPIAATMDDLERAYEIMAQPDPSDASSRLFPPPQWNPSDSKKRLIGVYKPWLEDCSPDVHAATQAAIQHLQTSAGYEVIDIELPLLSEGRKAHALTIMTEIGQGFCKGDTHGLTPANKVVVAISGQTPARDFVLAQRVRALLMSHLAWLWEKYGDTLVIVSPVTPTAGAKIIAEGHAEKGGAGVSDTNASLKSMQYVFLANFTGTPSISMPVGYSADGVPIGMMGLAAWGAEETLLSLGRACERYFENEVGRRRPAGEGCWADVLGAV
ncbi:uncharacterized protein H6S33_012026 [Morchella sextelata]|uniref:uncharacterized protein n=1 Tax=Morchella sextelata TaxID=1174677 RepID=UPI001D057BDC|nr:uncharacterized protein H6S33_012026 [Morchella sextelata]KAH0610499.1 hypothetical protein H6S33_012026 [Morchella sextelata]